MRGVTQQAREGSSPARRGLEQISQIARKANFLAQLLAAKPCVSPGRPPRASRTSPRGLMHNDYAVGSENVAVESICWGGTRCMQWRDSNYAFTERRE